VSDPTRAELKDRLGRIAVRAGEFQARAERAEAERDAALAEVARLRAALEQIRRETIEACAKVVDKQASIRRMRAHAFDDDSDRADGCAKVDDIEREEGEATLLEYTAARVRALPFTRAAKEKP